MGLYEFQNDRKVATLHVENPSAYLSVAFSPSGQSLACLAGPKDLLVWDLQDRNDITPAHWATVRLNGARLLARLSEIVDNVFLPQGSVLTSSQFGNMGEFVSFFVGEHSVDYLSGCHCDARNAYDPFNGMSVSGVDLLWVHLGSAPSEDRLFIQEVKSTAQANLAYANGLIDDYQKLFGIDQRLSLKARVSLLKAKVRSEWNLPDLSHRCSKFVGVDPTECDGVTILPTLVYDTALSADDVARQRLLYVRGALNGHGWNSSQIEMFGIGLQNLETTLTRLALGIA